MAARAAGLLLAFVALMAAFPGLAAAATVVPVVSAPSGPGAVSLVRAVKAPAGWSTEPVKVYPAGRVYEKIDGRDQTYLGFGLVEMTNLILKSADGSDGADIEVYDMGRPENALGVFAQQHRGPKAVYVDIGGAEGVNAGGQVAFWKDRFYAKIDRLSRKQAGEDKGSLLLSLARDVAGTISASPPVDRLVAPLPTRGRVPHSEGFTLAGYMGYAGLSSVRHARYNTDGREVTLFAMPTESPMAAIASVAAAEKANRQLTGVGYGGIVLERRYLGTVCLVRTDRYVVGSVDEIEGAGSTSLLRGLARYLCAHPTRIKDTMGMAPPPEAVVLFDGRSLGAWTIQDTTKPAAWRIENGYAQVQGGDITTKQLFTDCRLHVEFWCPSAPDAPWQSRGNSGVYLQGSYEVQVLDSYAVDPMQMGDCGAIYGVSLPRVNACRPAEEWQTYDIVFRAPRYDAKGNLERPAHFVTVYQNGVLIQANVDVPGPTTSAMARADLSKPGPLMLQDHGCPVRYRNIWTVPLKSAARGAK